MLTDTLNFKKNFLDYFKSSFKDNKKYFLISIISYIIFLVAYFFLFYYFSLLMNEIFSDNSSFFYQNLYFSLTLVLVVLLYVLDYVYYFFLLKIIANFILNIKKNMYIKLAKLDEKLFVDDESELFKLFYSDIIQLENNFAVSVLSFIRGISLVIFSFIIGLIFNSFLFLSSSSFILIIIILFIILVKFIIKLKKELTTIEVDSINYTYSAYKFAFLYSLYNVDSLNKKELKNRDVKFRKYSSYFSILDNIINSIFSISYFLSILSLLIFSTIYIDKSISINFINIVQVGFISLIFNVFFSQSLTDLKDLLLMKDNVSNIKNIVNQKTQDDDLINIETISSISFKNVSYKVDNKVILNDFSLDINKNEKIAIVGQIASGKTTIISLLLKKIKPTKGDIYINDININKISKKSLYKLISYLDSNCYIYDSTLRNNLLLNNQIIDDEKLNKIIDLVELNSLVDNLKNGLDTVLDFYSLSKGEKAKINLARNLIKNPPLFIFDQALSSLDIITAENIYNNIKDILKDKTIIDICYLKKELEKADYILVIKDGNLVEKGRLNQLLQVNGFFASLYQKGFSFD